MSVKPSNFKKPPLSQSEKEKLANQFIDNSSEVIQQHIKKQYSGKIKTLYLRAPESYYQDIQKIVELTGLTMNAVCLELLRPAIKHKLKELND